LHDAEHRSSIECVLVGAFDNAQLVALMRAHKRATDRVPGERRICRVIAHGTSATL
jgi:hypothetical protein